MTTQTVDAVLSVLKERGLLLAQDKSLPSVAGIVTGEAIRTSWWSHPKGRVIFAVLSHLADHDDVLVTKLLYGKDTLVHRRLWPALLAVGSAREPWQLRGLAAGARQLFRDIDSARAAVRATGVRSKPLVTRLLVVGRSVHTESGAHALALESWRAWSARIRCRPVSSAAAGRRQLESAAIELGASAAALPWTSARAAT